MKESHEAPPDLATISHQSEVVKSYVQQWFQLEIKEGRLIRKYDKGTETECIWQIVIPDEMKQEILQVSCWVQWRTSGSEKNHGKCSEPRLLDRLGKRCRRLHKKVLEMRRIFSRQTSLTRTFNKVFGWGANGTPGCGSHRSAHDIQEKQQVYCHRD